jgi:carbon-monoxide dehydrogenase medium subunit
LQDFDYVSPTTVNEVVALLSSGNGQAQILCGGTDLLAQLREGRRRASLLVDIKRVPDANALAFDPVAGLRLGAAVSCDRFCDDPDVKANYPGLVDAVSLIGGVQIQGRASIGGNLCNASPAADAIPALIVHEAVAVTAGPQGGREIPVQSFCSGPGQNVLQPGEFLVYLRVPPPRPHFGAHYLRLIPRNEMDIAVAGAGASVLLDEAGRRLISGRVALAAVAPTPLYIAETGEFLAGKEITPEVIAGAARIAQEAVKPIDDMRGTAEQRRHLAGVLTCRALEKAILRARG